MKKHDENKDVKAFSKIGKVETISKTLKVSKFATIGIHMWGRIDYLTHYCGYVLIWDNSAGLGVNTGESSNYNNSYKKNKKDYITENRLKRKSKNYE